MNTIVSIILSVLIVTSSRIGFTYAQTTQTENDMLNQIFKLLDDELAQWEQDSMYQYGNDDQELAKAIAAIYDMKITKFSTIETFMADQPIRRDEAATMFYRFVTAESSLSTSKINNNCDFPDLSQAHADLIEVVKHSCEAWLFYGAQGRFLPTSSITNAQAITVMARILDGKKDETQWHWADNYYDVLTAQGVMYGLAMRDKRNYDANISRWDIAILLYRVHNELVK